MTHELHTETPRRSDRRPALEQTRIRVLTADGRPDDRVVELQDLDAAGVGFVADRPLDAGQEFTIGFAGPGGAGATVDLLYRVAHCRPAGGTSFACGAEFVGVVSVGGGRRSAPIEGPRRAG